MRSTSGTSFLTTLWNRRRSVLEGVLGPSPARCATSLRYEYGMFKQSIREGWQQELPDNWLRRPDPWEVARPNETVDVKLNCSFEVRGGILHAVVDKPSSLIGIPFDRPVVGYGGKTVN